MDWELSSQGRPLKEELLAVETLAQPATKSMIRAKVIRVHFFMLSSFDLVGLWMIGYTNKV